MFLALIALLDIIAGIMLMFPGFGESIAFYVALLMLIKSLSSLLGGMLDSTFIFGLGLIDLLAALMIFFNFTVPWFWLLLLLKGTYSFLIGFLSG